MRENTIKGCNVNKNWFYALYEVDKIIMSSVVFKEFELVCLFLLSFSFHHHCQLVTGQLEQKSGEAAVPCSPFGFYWPSI